MIAPAIIFMELSNEKFSPRKDVSRSFIDKLEQEMSFEARKEELCKKTEKKRERRKSAGEPNKTSTENAAVTTELLHKQNELENEKKLLLNQLKDIDTEKEKNEKTLSILQAKNADLVCENDILCDRVGDLMIQNKNLHTLQKENTELRRENQELSSRVTSLKRLSRCIDRANDKFRSDISELRRRPSVADYQAVNQTIRRLRFVLFLLLVSFFSMLAHLSGLSGLLSTDSSIDNNEFWSSILNFSEYFQ
ncbi:uncharacterized protein [Antedon mediterranea]|uniref:uncharacterized protein n=1 Tax=Antedon mediterranea TaxID=105859 RepID=UPI003AF56C3D